MRSALRPRPCRYVTLCSLVGRCARSGGSWQLVCSPPRRARCEWPRSTMCDAAATRTANPPNGSPLRSACSLDGRSCFHGRAAAGARLGNVEDTMRCSSQRPSCTSSPRTPRATRSSLRSTRTSNPRARPPSNNEHAPLRNERLLPRLEKVSSPPSAATKTRCWSKHEQEEETRRTHRTSSDSRPAACSTRPRSTQPT